MRRPIGVFAGLIGLAVLCAPISAAEAAAQSSAEAKASCRVNVAKPSLTNALKIKSFATRRNCDDTALLRIRIKRAVPGPDPVVKSGASKDGRITLTLACKPGTYYAVATDYRGGTAKSRAIRLTCTPDSTPTPTPTTPTPTGTSTPTPSAPPPASGGAVGTAEENEVLRLTNAERAKGGCQPLKHDPQLRAAAFGHSDDMAKQGYFDHTSKDGRSFMDRIRAAGFSGGNAFAENIAFGQPSPASVVEGWMNSAGHRANIMNCRYNLIGVGVAKNSQGRIYWTQDFAAK
ncbi:CAP domain-containing protein [Nonomuraea angiospora]|uniref:Uncharacterized protein YkwD n=2 Tax=Nonomuraea angiospora TaxID=46172 RepID=A0ABR9M045_9ACTN|nr:CAP domain-containing protein [Nonomuraea angiospora]MBE1585883.1 uncharacterized protein YkwD [Nonomuraea angiospora]